MQSTNHVELAVSQDLGVEERGQPVAQRSGAGRLGRDFRDLREIDRGLQATNLLTLGAALLTGGVAAAVVCRKPRWFTVAPAFVAVSAAQQTLLNIEHDCTHNVFVRGRRWNERIGSWFTGGPVLSPFRSSAARHLAHHRLVGTPDDPDFDLHNGAGGATRGGLVRHLLSGLTGGYAAKVFLARGASPDGDAAPASAEVVRSDLVSVAAAQLVVAGTVTAAGGWWAYPVLWLAPLGTLTAGMHLTRSFVEHALLPGEASEHGNLLITISSNRAERLLVAPFNMNHHAEHHLFPWVPARRLPVVRQRLAGRVDGPPILRRRSYLDAVRRHLAARPRAA